MSEESDEIARLRQWVADLQSGMYVNCVYCGHQYGPQESTPTSMAEQLKFHVAKCPAHPMAKLVKAAKVAYHTISELRYTRDGVPDERLDEYREFIRTAYEEATNETLRP